VRGETAIRHGGAPPGAAGPPPAAASARPAVEQIEVAAYYVIAEAFTNAAKHAQASVVDVTVDVADGMLRVRVCDDGSGAANLGLRIGGPEGPRRSARRAGVAGEPGWGRDDGTGHDAFPRTVPDRGLAHRKHVRG